LNEDIINAEKTLDSAKINLEQESRTYEYDKVMLQNGEMSQNDVNEQEVIYEAAKSTYDKATVALESAKVTASQGLAEAKNTYDTAQATADDTSTRLALEDKKSNLQDAQVIATVDGTVTNVNAVVGTEASGALFVIQDLNNLIVNASVDETDVANVEVGQRVEITTDASGADIVEAEVLSVEPVSSAASESTSSTSSSGTTTTTTTDSTSSDVSFTVKVQLTGENDKVKVGMNAVVNIITTEKSDVYSVPYAAVVTKDGISNVYAAVKKDKEYVVKEIPVTKGIESATNAEIEGADLTDGMIILSDSTGYSDGSIVVISDPKSSSTAGSKKTK
jgi:multidrug resistance efflux pump